MRNEVERLSRGRGRAPLDKPAKQRLIYLLLIYLYRIYEAVCFREQRSSATISEEEVEKSVGEIMGMDQGQVEALMADLWEEYLGELNVELAAYFSC